MTVLFSLTLLIAGVLISGGTASADASYNDGTGVSFFEDSAFTKPVNYYLNETDEMSYPRAVLPTTGGHLYLRLQDTEYFSFRPSASKPLITILDKEEKEITDRAVIDTVTWKEMEGSKEGDYRYDITFSGEKQYGMLYLQLGYQSKLLFADSDWEDYEAGMVGIYVDYMDEGLNVSDRNDMVFSYGFENDEIITGKENNLGFADYSKGYAFAPPAPGLDSLVSFAVYEDGKTKLIREASSLKVYQADGVTPTDKLTILDYEPPYKTDNKGLMQVSPAPGSADDLIGDYIIRYNDGSKTYDLKYTLELPIFGIYEKPIREAKYLVEETFFTTPPKNKKYYILTDRDSFGTIDFAHLYHGDTEDTLKISKLQDISDGKDLYGYSFQIGFSYDGPYRLKVIDTIGESGNVRRYTAAIYFYLKAPKKGKTFKLGDFTYKMTKTAGGYMSVNGEAALTKVKKGLKKFSHYGYENIYGRYVQITSIGASAFKGQKKLKRIDLQNMTKLKSIGKNAFRGVPKKAVAIVPKSKKKKYKKMLKNAGFKGKIRVA